MKTNEVVSKKKVRRGRGNVSFAANPPVWYVEPASLSTTAARITYSPTGSDIG